MHQQIMVQIIIQVIDRGTVLDRLKNPVGISTGESANLVHPVTLNTAVPTVINSDTDSLIVGKLSLTEKGLLIGTQTKCQKGEKTMKNRIDTVVQFITQEILLKVSSFVL